MFRQILLGLTIFASFVFASYSLYPVPAANSGEIKIAPSFLMVDGVADSKHKQYGVALKTRIVPATNLELFFSVPFVVASSSYDECLEALAPYDDGSRDPSFYCMEKGFYTGAQNLSAGVRFQALPNVALFAEMTAPTGKESISSQVFELFLGGQYSTKFGPLELGTELGLVYLTENDEKNWAEKQGPMQIAVAFELNYSVIPIVLPYIGGMVNVVLTNPEFRSGAVGPETQGLVGFFPYLGAGFIISDLFSVDLKTIFSIGDDYTELFGGKGRLVIELSFIAHWH
ncbi:hypothetical protein Fisuc_1963 [Fibrobacter succinogenes subsp. succinogenes S85]|uniref:MetA-pathway of phenol degradation n=2 Tax=Fibrobacter succinogenes TaxID=833 RepID=A0ABN3YY60_FIBSS|nr:hypothetical protein [Fibrobacter succinogenes]ACX75552.1 hypothetical protein Fisuc_1963 [Fibrobacter succinogenes subsp. succinogenes S85]